MYIDLISINQSCLLCPTTYMVPCITSFQEHLNWIRTFSLIVIPCRWISDLDTIFRKRYQAKKEPSVRLTIKEFKPV